MFCYVTDIEDEFRRSPRDKIEYQTKDHQFECIPPNGYPRPKVVEWRKDGKTLFQIKDDKKTRKYNDRWFFRREGKVRILSFWTRLDSAGVYTCVARNSEGLRISKPAKLTVKGKCPIFRSIDHIKLYYFHSFIYSRRGFQHFQNDC